MNSLLRKIFVVCLPTVYGFAAYAQNTVRTLHGVKVAEYAPQMLNNSDSLWKSKKQVILFFKQLPENNEKLLLERSGISVLQPLDATHWVALTQNRTARVPESLLGLIEGFYEVKPADKFMFAPSQIPADSLGAVKFDLEFLTGNGAQLLKKYARNVSYTIYPDSFVHSRVVIGVSNFAALTQLAALPEVACISINLSRIAPLNYLTHGQARASYAKIKQGLDGTGVCIGAGDIGWFEPHLDFQHRFTHCDIGYYPAYTYHPTMVAGNMAGAGVLNEYLEGFAPKAKVITDYYSKILYNGSLFYSKARMVAGNHSYSLLPPPFISNCGTFGTYNSDCRFFDQTVRQIKYQSHVLAAGNNGGTACSGFPTSYATLSEGYQNSKNGITVGMVNNSDGLSFGSLGPTRDKRIKPDIVSKGVSITSDYPVNSLNSSSGSSYSAPGVTGSIALLTQRYRQLNANKDPESALVKALLLNGAQDLGNTGPDFAYGFGRLDLERSIANLEAGRYTTSQVVHGDSFSYTLNVPAGVSNLKIMLYWHDTTGSGISYKALINDLDLRVKDPSGTLNLPWVLDTLPANVDDPATTGTDHLNNVEQVTLASPAAGNYILKIYGYDVPLGPQKFYLTYSYEKPGVKIAWPTDGEVLVAGITQNIRINETGISSGSYTLELSNDGGSTWSTLTSSLASGNTVYTGWFPTTAGNNYLLRITHNSLPYADTLKLPLVVLGKPTVSSISSCGKQVTLNWGAVSGATDYEILRLQGGFWTQAAITSSTSATVRAFANAGETEYYVVRARLNGVAGKRNTASSVVVSSSTCSSSTEMGAFDLLYPKVGRKFTHSELKASQVFRIRNKNFGNNSISTTVTTGFNLNGSTYNNSYSQTIAANDTLSKALSTTLNLSSTGTYAYKIWSSIGDANPLNDTLKGTLKHLANNPITLPYLLDFESAADTVYEQQAYGLDGIEMVDFYSNNMGGVLKTHPGPLLTKGNRALCLHKKTGTASYEQNYAYITLNLSSYSSSKISMAFDYRLTGETFHSGDSIWVRGADSLSWINVYALKSSAAQSDFVTVKDVEIGTALSAASQTPSASFQIRIGEYDNKKMRSYYDSAGIIIDNLRLYETSTDIALNSLSSPKLKCGQVADTVKILFKNNSSSSVSSIPFAYKLDNGGWIRDTFTGSVNAGTTASFTFKTLISINDNLSHSLTVVQLKSGDQNSVNDTLQVSGIRFLKQISSLPFLDNFESSATPFYAEGTNSSWERSTPAGAMVQYAASGSKCWSTGAGTDYNNNEQSYLYSPCFDLSNASTDLKLSFHNTHNLESSYDGYWIEYTTDLVNWSRLGTSGTSYNGYNRTAPFYFWDNTRNSWKVTGFSVPVSSMASKKTVQFRFAMYSDADVHYDGPNIDDFHLFDSSSGVYSGTTLTQTLTGSGNGWVNFSNGKNYFLSINDSSQALGSSLGGVHPYVGSTRQYNGQYTMNRSWWIKPTGNITGSMKVRLYYTESEADNLLSADAFMDKFKQFGVTRYHGPKEDSVFYNDSWDATAYTFYPPSLKIAPFYNGQYVEFSCSGLSEFWINSGTFLQTVPLDKRWLAVNGYKSNNRNIVLWETEPGCTESIFELYGYAPGLKSKAVKLGQTPSVCNVGNYSLEDTVLYKYSAFYYVVEKAYNGDLSTSETVFIEGLYNRGTMVIPNPNYGNFTLFLPENRTGVDIRIIDQSGRTVDFLKSVQGKAIELHLAQNLSSGVYVAEISGKNKVEKIKIVVQ